MDRGPHRNRFGSRTADAPFAGNRDGWEAAVRPTADANSGLKVTSGPACGPLVVRGYFGRGFGRTRVSRDVTRRSPHIRQRSNSHDWHHPYVSPPQRVGIHGPTPISGMRPLCTKDKPASLLFAMPKGRRSPAARRAEEGSGIVVSGEGAYRRPPHQPARCEAAAPKQRRTAHSGLPCVLVLSIIDPACQRCPAGPRSRTWNGTYARVRRATPAAERGVPARA